MTYIPIVYIPRTQMIPGSTFKNRGQLSSRYAYKPLLRWGLPYRMYHQQQQSWLVPWSIAGFAKPINISICVHMYVNMKDVHTRICTCAYVDFKKCVHRY